MTISVDIKGLKEMDANLRALGAEMGAKTLRGALRDAAKPLEEYMKANAPVSDYARVVKKFSGEKVTITPGFLKSRIKRKTRLNKKGVSNRRFKGGSVAVVQTGVFRVPYVLHVEYGTSHNRAFSFIRGAASKRSEAEAIFVARLKRRIELAQRKLAKATT